jgi:hypothetical protein
MRAQLTDVGFITFIDKYVVYFSKYIICLAYSLWKSGSIHICELPWSCAMQQGYALLHIDADFEEVKYFAASYFNWMAIMCSALSIEASSLKLIAAGQSPKWHRQDNKNLYWLKEKLSSIYPSPQSVPGCSIKRPKFVKFPGFIPHIPSACSRDDPFAAPAPGTTLCCGDSRYSCRPIFGKLPSVDLFLENDNLTTFFLLTDLNATSIVSQILKGGAICPSTCFLVFFKPSKIIFRQPKGGGRGPLAPLGTPLSDR